MKTESEFGKGLTYCLGMFLAHAEMWKSRGEFEFGLKPSLWFNGSSDHLYELEMPDKMPKELKKRIILFRDKCLEWGHGFKIEATMEDYTWSIEEAKELLRLIDEYNGIKTIEASWK